MPSRPGIFKAEPTPIALHQDYDYPRFGGRDKDKPPSTSLNT